MVRAFLAFRKRRCLMSYTWQRRPTKRRANALATARAQPARKPRRAALRLEPLQSFILLTCGPFAPFRTITGASNNLAHPDFGEAATDPLQVSPTAHAPG